MALPRPTTPTRDIVVVGASAGGVTALPRLLHALPSNLPASVFIVQHQAPSEDPQLANILSRASSLEVRWAEQGEKLQRGRVYVAPPDVHMTFVEGEHLQLSRGPRENYARPSIDRLFRSAAANLDGRTIAVLLTGMMEDGVAGALAIQESGGRVIVQDPADAEFPELPTRALATFAPDAIASLDRIAATLTEMVGEPVPGNAAPSSVVLESALDHRHAASSEEMDRIGAKSPIRCPECGGSLWAVHDPRLARWRCYLGHVASARELLARSDESLESALWNAVRVLHDHAVTLDTLAEKARGLGTTRILGEYETRARETRLQAEVARQFMLDLLKRPR